MSYNVTFTNKNITPIQIADDEVNYNLDLALFGYEEPLYGRSLQENFLHLLENFALGSLPNNDNLPNMADASLLDEADNIPVLHNPVNGQTWFNKTNSTLYVYNNGVWNPLARGSEIAASWGVIANGQQIPLPVSSNGVVFTYQDCAWVVSAFNYPQGIDSLLCEADDNANVTVQYTYVNDNTHTIQNGYANYLIIGVKGNRNYIPQPSPTPTISVTPSMTNTPASSLLPTPTPSITPSITASVGASPTPAPSITPTPTQSQQVSPTPRPSTTPQPSATPQPTISPTPSISISRTPYISPTPAPTITPTPSSNYISSVSLSSINLSFLTTCYQGATTVSHSQNLTATMNGGIGPYNISINYISGAQFGTQVNNLSSNSVQCVFSYTGTCNNNPVQGYYTVTATDANGGVATSAQIGVTFEYDKSGTERQ